MTDPGSQEHSDLTPKVDIKDNTYILTEVDEIARINDDEKRNDRINQFIEKRKRELEIDSYAGEISFLFPSTDKFLGEKAKIATSTLADPLVMDDDQIYIDFFETLRTLRTDPRWKDQSINNLIPHAFQGSIGRYFGGQRVYDGGDEIRKEIYAQGASTNPIGISVSEFRGKGVAQCAERASMSHNLYLLLGYDAELIVSNTCQMEGNEDLHLFNKLNSNGKTILYDPSNPYEVLSEEGKATYYPAIFVLIPEQAGGFDKGEQVEVKRIEMQRGNDGNLKPISQQIWVYGRHTPW
jgi:hypothetical protein